MVLVPIWFLPVGRLASFAALKSAEDLKPAGGRILVRDRGAVLDGYDLRDAWVDAAADGIVLRNCLFASRVGSYSVVQSAKASGLVIEHCTFDGEKRAAGHSTTFVNGGAGQITVRRTLFRNGTSDGIVITHGLVEQCEIALGGYDPKAHADGIFVPRTTGPVLIRENRLSAEQPGDAPRNTINNCIRAVGLQSVTQLRIEDNVIIAHPVAYAIHLGIAPAAAAAGGVHTGTVVRNNKFRVNTPKRACYPNPPADTVWEGNTHLDTGAPIPVHRT